jgi:hypothetical protein
VPSPARAGPVTSQIRLLTDPPWNEPWYRTRIDLATPLHRPTKFQDADEEHVFDEIVHIFNHTKGYRDIIAQYVRPPETGQRSRQPRPHLQCQAWLVDTIAPYYTFYREMADPAPACAKLARLVFGNDGNMNDDLLEEGTARVALGV